MKSAACDDQLIGHESFSKRIVVLADFGNKSLHPQIVLH